MFEYPKFSELVGSLHQLPPTALLELSFGMFTPGVVDLLSDVFRAVRRPSHGKKMYLRRYYRRSSDPIIREFAVELSKEG